MNCFTSWQKKSVDSGGDDNDSDASTNTNNLSHFIEKMSSNSLMSPFF